MRRQKYNKAIAFAIEQNIYDSIREVTYSEGLSVSEFIRNSVYDKLAKLSVDVKFLADNPVTEKKPVEAEKAVADSKKAGSFIGGRAEDFVSIKEIFGKGGKEEKKSGDIK